MDMEKGGIGSTRLHLKVQDQSVFYQALVSLDYIFHVYFCKCCNFSRNTQKLLYSLLFYLFIINV